MSSSAGEIWFIVLLVAVGLLAVWLVIWLAIKLIRWAFVGAVFLFAIAANQAFLGLAAYVACWVLLFPAMLVITIIIGIFVDASTGSDAREEGRIRKTRRQLGLGED